MLDIDSDELNYKFVRSSGAGGQNINKVATKAVLPWGLEDSKILSNSAKKRFLDRFGGYVSHEGVVMITSQKYRVQLRNKEDAYLKLVEMLKKILPEPKRRRKTKISKAKKENRLNEKKLKSKTKDSRRAVRDF